MSSPRARTMAHMRQLMAVAAVAGFAATTNRPSSAETPDGGTPPDGGPLNEDGGTGDGGPTATTGVLTGQVIDSQSKAPIADVIVTITSPALTGEQVFVTDAAGKFNVPNLPPGEYTVSVMKDPYRPTSHSNIILSAGSTVEVQFELSVDGGYAGYMVVDPIPPPAGCGCRQGY
ncbi:MAG TPA: carboxypeptidase-like regulatory domain-containing protein [Polyangium sp.]|nr:carboxypeptidase-like regulatory domain-containing protein [Polyangium sp.]